DAASVRRATGAPARLRPAGSRGPRRRRPATRGRSPPRSACSSLDPYRIILDDRVRQQLVGDLPGLLGRLVRVGSTLAGELDLDPLADTYRGDAGDPEVRQRVGDRLALGVEDLGLEHDVNDDASHGHSCPSIRLVRASSRARDLPYGRGKRTGQARSSARRPSALAQLVMIYTT